MNREQKAAAIAEIADQIKESQAVFAVDFRGISVPPAARARTPPRPAGARLVGRALGERVLDDAEARIRLAQARPQIGGLRNGRPAVVDRVHRLGFRDLDGHLIDDRGFLVSVQQLLLSGTSGRDGPPGVSGGAEMSEGFRAPGDRAVAAGSATPPTPPPRPGRACAPGRP